MAHVNLLPTPISLLRVLHTWQTPMTLNKAWSWACASSSQYLGSGEEDLVSDVSQPTGHHPKSNSREHVGIVALARKESLSIWKSDWVERAATGKDRTPLQHRESTSDKENSHRRQSNGCPVGPGAGVSVLPTGQEGMLATVLCINLSRSGQSTGFLRLPLCSLQWSNHRPNNHIRDTSNYRLLRMKSTGS